MRTNTQPAEKKLYSLALEVHSVFNTIQGEGPFAGRCATFIRLAGCNLMCPKCDTEYTSNRYTMYPSELIKKSQSLVVITGGEPFRQPVGLSHLIRELSAVGKIVQIETNGSLPVEIESISKAVVVCSPKAKVHSSLWDHCENVKYVLDADSVDPDDGLPIKALDHSVHNRVSRPPEGWGGTVWLQPVDVQDQEENKRHTRAVVQSCLKYGYRLCLQLHKIVGLD